jgi:CYTH domain-containing protein
VKNLEIERKYLVDKTKWALVEKPAGIHYVQGYLGIDDHKAVRVRVAGEKGFLTIKGRSDHLSRPEYEYLIPATDAAELIRLFCGSTIEKIRFRLPVGDHIWEIDEFLGENNGLLMAEIELEDADELFEIPSWVEKEVTGDARYYNSYLSVHPYQTWK